MTRFEIKTDSFEFRMGNVFDSIPSMSKEEIFDTYQSCDTRITSNCVYPATEMVFDSLDDARKAFAEDYADYGYTRFEKAYVGWVLRGAIAWIEENEYDAEGDFDQSVAVYDISVEPFVK